MAERLLPSPTKPAAEVGMGPHEDRAIVFIIDPVPEVTIPCRIVVIGISGEFIIVDGCGRRSVEWSRCVDRCGGNVGAAIDDRANRDDRTAEIRPMIDRESNSDVTDCAHMAKTGADINLRITFGSDEAGGYDGSENKKLFHICNF